MLVINIKSISYTGTTWINYLLGCHKNAFALGPPDRVINLEDWSKACQIHDNCPFWIEFQKVYDPDKNFYRQLSEFSGKDFIIINNPVKGSKAERDLENVKKIQVIRDGRAVCRSYTQNKNSDFQSAVLWFTPSAANVKLGEVFDVRYEDVIRDQFSMIKKMGDFIGLEYPENFYKFWEFDHHATGGNASISSMIKCFRGEPFVINESRLRFYEREFERLKNEPEKPVFDERWKTLSREELYFFDHFCGAINESWGYPRDVFTEEEIKNFEGYLLRK